MYTINNGSSDIGIRIISNSAIDTNTSCGVMMWFSSTKAYTVNVSMVTYTHLKSVISCSTTSKQNLQLINIIKDLILYK